jgi:hypothetical protein
MHGMHKHLFSDVVETYQTGKSLAIKLNLEEIIMKEGRILRQKRTARVTGVLLAFLVALCGVGLAQAKAKAVKGATQASTNVGDPVQSHNKSNKGLKSPHSARKQAAKRLKVIHQKEHQQKLHGWAKAHKGQGQAGGTK